MATTAQLRAWFPEPIVSRNPLRCDYSRLVGVRFLAGKSVKATLGRDYIILKVHPKTVPMFQALAATFHRWGYSFDEMAGGSAVCRLITGGSNTSPHAHGIAVDINPSRNGYRTTTGALDDPETSEVEGGLKWGRFTDMPPGMIREIEGIRTGNGHRAIQWGGRWWSVKDPMHFEPYTHPNNLATGIRLSTVPGWDGYQNWLKGGTGNMQGFLPMSQGDGSGNKEWKKSDVAAIQALMNRAFGTSLKTDGVYGPATSAAIAKHLPDQNSPDGKHFFGNRFDDLMWALAVRAASSISGGGGGVSESRVRALINQHAEQPASPTVHPHRHAEGTTGLPQ